MEIPIQISQRVDNYIKYRPRYPRIIIQVLREKCQLAPRHTIADIGCGPGILAALFLQNGNPVIGIEPDPDMRAGAALYLADRPHFTCLAGSAEETTLPDGSVDFVTVGQAFHWFDLERTKQEFARILVPGGWVVLVWNIQKSSGTPFLEALQAFWADRRFWKPASAEAAEQMARAQKYRRESRRLKQDLLEPFFSNESFQQVQFENPLVCDFAGLKGRVLSNGPALAPGDMRFPPMIDALKKIFLAHQVKGTVTIEHETVVVFGQLRP